MTHDNETLVALVAQLRGDIAAAKTATSWTEAQQILHASETPTGDDRASDIVPILDGDLNPL